MKRSAKISEPAGAILVCVLVCMAIATTIMMVSVRSSLTVRRQMRQELQLEQTRWLLEAAVQRAANKIRQQPDYRGETWRVEPPLDAYPLGVVKIAVTTDDLQPDRASLSVVVRLGGQGTASETTQRSETVIARIPKSDSNTP